MVQWIGCSVPARPASSWSIRRNATFAARISFRRPTAFCSAPFAARNWRCRGLLASGAGPRTTILLLLAAGAESGDTHARCRHCRDADFAFDAVMALGNYHDELRSAVLRIKLPAGETLANTMGRLLAYQCRAALEQFAPTAILAVPMHWTRRIARGTNNPELLAAAVGKVLGVRGGLARIGSPPPDRASERAVAGAPSRECSGSISRRARQALSPRSGVAGGRRVDDRFDGQRSRRSDPPRRRRRRGDCGAGPGGRPTGSEAGFGRQG